MLWANSAGITEHMAEVVGCLRMDYYYRTEKKHLKQITLFLFTPESKNYYFVKDKIIMEKLKKRSDMFHKLV